MKRLINLKNETFKKYLKDGRPNFVYENLQTIAKNQTQTICSSKNVNYQRLANKLNDPNALSKRNTGQ